MMTLIPPNESERIEALRSYSILDTPEEAAYNDLAELAARICQTPMVAVSLVDTDRQWFKARVGIQATQTERQHAFCARGITQKSDLLVVPDARLDARFADLPMVRAKPPVQFYAGAKLSNTDGYALGMLCVMDHRPRQLDERQIEALQMLARQVVAQMELRRELATHQRSRAILESNQDDLRKSKALYQSLVENLPLFVLRKDREGRITFANRLLCEAANLPPDKITGLTDFDLLPKPIAARIRACDSQVMATGQMMETTQEIPFGNGKSARVQMSILPLIDLNGNRTGVQVIAKDFTEWYQLEARLLKAQEELENRVRERTADMETAMTSLKTAKHDISEWKERYDLIVSSTGLAVYDIDRVTGEVSWSSGAERILGADALSVNRASEEWLELVHEQDRQAVMRGIGAAIETGQSFEIQYRLRHGPNHYRWIQDRGLVVPDAEGRCIRVLGMMQDVTQRKLSEDTMREQARLLDLSQDAIMVRDLKNKVLYWNQTAQNIYGWTYGEALGKPVEDLLLRGELAHIPTAHAIALKNGEWSGEVKLYTKDGKELIVNSRWTLLRDPNGKPHALLVTHTNLTERKLLEEKFLRAQRLESVGALASGIAHDLNNVFTPILMSTQLLADPLDPATRANMLGILTTSARRGSEMVKQVLTFARGAESGQGIVQLKHLVGELETMMRDTFPPAIAIKKTVAADLWPVRGDPTQLYQVLINLCINARDAMPEGGALRIEAANAPNHHASDGAPGKKAGPFVCITVADTGSGMTPEVQRKIFEPFFTTKEAGKGTGLGLSTVQTLVHAHGGHINLESKLGAGTQFNLFFPAEAVEKFDAAPARIEPPDGNHELLLFIDDESSIRQIIKTTLEAHDYNVLVAGDGSDGLELYTKERQRCALVITDLAMPGLDGYATIRALRNINPQLKIIAMTGVLEQQKLECLTEHKITLLKKPVSADTLLNTIHNILRLPST